MPHFFCQVVLACSVAKHSAVCSARMVIEVFWPALAVTIFSVAIGLYKEIAVGQHGA